MKKIKKMKCPVCNSGLKYFDFALNKIWVCEICGCVVIKRVMETDKLGTEL